MNVILKILPPFDIALHAGEVGYLDLMLSETARARVAIRHILHLDNFVMYFGRADEKIVHGYLDYENNIGAFVEDE